MKKRIGALLLAVMMVMGLALLAGCSKKDAPQEDEKPTLVGIWKVVDIQDYDYGEQVQFLTFGEQGQYKTWLEDANNGEVLDEASGTYSFTENALTVTVDGDENKTECTYEISGTTLTLTGTNNDGSTQTVRLTRVQ